MSSPSSASWAVRLLLPVAVVLFVVVLAVGLLTRAGEQRSEPARVASPAPELRGAPPALAGLHRQSGELLDGGPEAFRARLAELRGHPVVVNKWASWCPPCREEFPVLERVARSRGREVAFVGVNAMDDAAKAERFLARNPTSFPHFRDPDQEVARVFKGNAGFPTTAFYDARGNLVVAKQVAYRSEAELLRDIERYVG